MSGPRTFLAAYALDPVGAGAWEPRLAAWQALLPAAPVSVVRAGRVALLLGGAAREGSGVRVEHDEAAERLALHAGPRVGLRAGAPAGRDAGEDTTVVLRHQRQAGTLVVKTDLLNSTFVFHVLHDGFLFLSDSSLVLRRLAGAALEPESVLELVATGSLYGNRSLYRGIGSLEPSRVHTFHPDGRRESEAYWDLARIPYGSLDLRAACDRIVPLVDADVRALAATGARFVFDLTGGYDSRCNLAFALRQRLPVRTIVAGPADSADVVIARSIAARHGLLLEHVPDAEPARLREAVQEAVACTDLEYDLLEYAQILEIHTRHYAPDELSVHGSTADVMRNYFLLPGFTRPDPDGELQLDAVVARKFTPAVDTERFFRAPLARPWAPHMRAQLERCDVPGLPATARLDNIYLRIRMQFWQGRLASATNRIHPSFTPWTNREVLEAILATRWRDKRRGMLSRELLVRTGQGLDRFPLAGPGTAGRGPAAELRGLRATARYYAQRLAQRLRPARAAAPARAPQEWVREELARHVESLEPYVAPDVLAGLAQGQADLPAMVLARLYTVSLAARDGGQPVPAYLLKNGCVQALGRAVRRRSFGPALRDFLRRRRFGLASCLGLGRPAPRFPILVYHRVLPEDDPFSIGVMPARDFAWQMEILATHFRVVPLERLVSEWREGRLLPGTVSVTLDDGYRDNHDVALPILRRCGVPATIFLATGVIGTHGRLWYDRVLSLLRRTERTQLALPEAGLPPAPLLTVEQRRAAALTLLEHLKELAPVARDALIGRLEAACAPLAPEGERLMLDWAEVRAMQAAGVSFGAHTVSHPILSRLDDAEAEREITESKRVLERELGRPVTLFAYPNGQPGDFHAGTRAIVERAGFACAVSTVAGINGPAQDRFALVRRQAWDSSPDAFLGRLLLETFMA